MTSIQPFLSPIAGENACGTDISYDPAFLDLETLVKGKEEVQLGDYQTPAEDPNWREVQAVALELLAKSKHLRLGILVTVALLQTEGLPGFSNGLTLLSDWIKNYWDGLYPLLDADDNNDPTERVNLLQALSPLKPDVGERILHRLASAPLAESPKMGRYSLKAILEAPGKPEFAAAFQDTDKETLRLRHDAAVSAAAAAAEMQQSLTERLGAERAPNFHDLDKTLKQISGQIAPYLGIAAPPGLEAGSQPAAGGQAAGPGVPVGSIANRADVVRTLGAICSYYKTHEPASPIPLLLERAQRLVNKEFIEIMTDLAPDSMAQINVIAGRKPEENK